MKEFFENYPYVLLILEGFYLVFTILLGGKIIMDTKTTSKTLAYLMLIVFLPFVGIIIYFVFGVNYRKNKFYKFKIEHNEKIYQEIRKFIQSEHSASLNIAPKDLNRFVKTIDFLYRGFYSPLTHSNHAEVLINGEEKFPKVLEVLKNAKHHIHLEYYIYDNDIIGNTIADILMEKARSGVKVRLLYDDLGSSNLKKPFREKLMQAGVEVAPVNKITFKLFANRINYRDHRKIIIVDGLHVFTGGINVSDKYINPNPKIYWRDTHLYMRGNCAYYFQFLFLSNWMVATEKMVSIDRSYFNQEVEVEGDKLVQVAVSGPDIKPGIMLSTASSIYAATKRVFITTPYFIPTTSILNAIKQQAIAGVDVRLLVPKNGDSLMVNSAAYSYYEELLESNVKVYFYEKGFVHAKTMLIDDDFACIGTANMDIRSQELNFEVNTHVYNSEINAKLADAFFEDLKSSIEIRLEDWEKRPKGRVFFEHLARLMSPLL